MLTTYKTGSQAVGCGAPDSTIIQEYLAWGAVQGGRGGRPWSATHMKKKRRHFELWKEWLRFEVIQDIELPKVEAVLRKIHRTGVMKRKEPHELGGKSLQNYTETLRALCLWAKKRGYLDCDPLEGMGRFDMTPKSRRRALTAEEIAGILEHAYDEEERRYSRWPFVQDTGGWS